MAYRRSNGKGRRTKKVEPAELTMTFVTPNVPSATTDEFYIDLSQCVSLLNRRFYRQGINWAVQSIKVITQATSGTIAVQKLPSSWTFSNAWNKGFRTWQRLNDEATDESPSIKPRFMDFKIYADAQHHADGYPSNLLPYTYNQPAGGLITPNTAVAGEWVASKIVVPKTDGTDDVSNRDIIGVGPSYPGAGFSTNNAVSLIEGYAAGRALPDIKDPNMPDDASSVDVVAAENWMQATFNEGTDQDHEVIEDLLNDNNIAPYPFENDGTNLDTMYPGGANQLIGLALHDLEIISNTTIGGKTAIKGGLFPCGLMKFSINNPELTSLPYIIQVNLVPGHHRGYLCEPMTEM